MTQNEQLKLHLISLGCARNQVDSEMMFGKLFDDGWTLTPDPSDANVIIINTCSFIESATNESINTILAMAEFKKSGSCSRLIVTGCFPERFREDILKALPEVDIFLGTGAYDQIDSIVKIPDPISSQCVLPDPQSNSLKAYNNRKSFTKPHSAYIKIAEGCNRHCTYCIIPKLRGHQRSRLPEDILLDANFMIASGAKELVLISQETTNYGIDLTKPTNLSKLLELLTQSNKTPWIRFLYGHPYSLDDTIIETVSKIENICAYFDLPIQHSSDFVLKRMGRNYKSKDLLKLFTKIKLRIPEVALRTTVMVGFPGEGAKEFNELLSFVKEVEFDHLGCFIYSDASDLKSHTFLDHVPQITARDRYDRLMLLQKEISYKKNKKHVGKSLKVLVEQQFQGNIYLGRTYFQGPEVDGITYIYSKNKDGEKIGDFSHVKITDALDYDLIGTAL